MNRRWMWIGSVVLLVALAGGGVALSQADKSAPFGRKAELNERFMRALAEELGVSETRLTAALKAARLKTVDDAVTAGLLSREQASQLKERINAGAAGFEFGFERFKGKDSRLRDDRRAANHRALRVLAADERARAAIGDAIAKELGTTRDGLANQLRDGARLDELMKANNVTEEQLGAAAANAASSHIDRLVGAGTIDRATADEALASLTRGGIIGKIVRLSIFPTR